MFETSYCYKSLKKKENRKEYTSQYNVQSTCHTKTTGSLVPEAVSLKKERPAASPKQSFAPSYTKLQGFPGGSDGKESASSAGDPGLIPGSGISLGEGNGNPLQYSCLENPTEEPVGSQWSHKESNTTTHTSHQTSVPPRNVTFAGVNLKFPGQHWWCNLQDKDPCHSFPSKEGQVWNNPFFSYANIFLPHSPSAYRNPPFCIVSQQAYFNLVHFRYSVFYKLNVCGNLGLRSPSGPFFQQHLLSSCSCVTFW